MKNIHFFLSNKQMHGITTLVISVLFLLMLSVPLSAQLIVYESFNYAIGTKAPDPDGGTPATGLPYTNVGGDPAGTGVGLRVHYGADNEVVAGLSYSNAGGALVTNNNALKRTASAQGDYTTEVKLYNGMTTDPFAAYRSQADAQWFGWNAASGQKELYFSVLVNVNAINSTTNRAGLSLYVGHDNTNAVTGIAQFNSKWYYYHQGASAPFELGEPVVNQTEFVVGRYTFVSATQFKVDIWFNPTLGAALGTPTATHTATTTTSGGQFRSLINRFGSGVFTYDEFRLGLTAADVMPKSPSTKIENVVNNSYRVFQSGKNQISVHANEMDDLSTAQLEVFDTKGAMVHQAERFTQNATVNTLSEGLYLVRIVTAGGSVMQKVLVK